MAYCGTQQPLVQQGDCEDCVQVVRTTKKVQVPCTRNTYKQYTVKIPRQVTEQVPKNVCYTDTETRTRQVPYTEHKPVQRIRMTTENYKVPVCNTHIRMVPVTKKVPKTVFVNVTTQCPQKYQTTTMVNKCRQVPVPYTDMVPETKYRTESYTVPVQRNKTVMETRCKTVFDEQVRTQCIPKTTMVTKEVPVYNVVAKPAPPCPPGADCGQRPLTSGGGYAPVDPGYAPVDPGYAPVDPGYAPVDPGYAPVNTGYKGLEEPMTGPTGYRPLEEPMTGPTGYGARPLEQPMTGPTGYGARPLEEPMTGPTGYGARPLEQPMTGPTGYGARPLEQPMTGPTGYGASPLEKPMTGPTGYGATPLREEPMSYGNEQPRPTY